MKFHSRAATCQTPTASDAIHSDGGSCLIWSPHFVLDVQHDQLVSNARLRRFLLVVMDLHCKCVIVWHMNVLYRNMRGRRVRSLSPYLDPIQDSPLHILFYLQLNLLIVRSSVRSTEESNVLVNFIEVRCMNCKGYC